jgi:hypothetical protein
MVWCNAGCRAQAYRICVFSKPKPKDAAQRIVQPFRAQNKANCGEITGIDLSANCPMIDVSDKTAPQAVAWAYLYGVLTRHSVKSMLPFEKYRSTRAGELRQWRKRWAHPTCMRSWQQDWLEASA